jgi:RNA polymerase sigma-70 factor (ECF subfamily)
MTAYQAGDVASFEALMVRYERPLWAFVRRFVGEGALAEDLLQETFLRVVRGARDWKPDARVSTWLYTIARNLCTDHARRAVHRRALSLDAPARPSGDDGSGPVLADRVASKAAGAERQTLDRELRAHIDEAIGALPVDQREVFLMREMMDLSFADIAQAVGASEPTVKSRMRYALEKLREALATFYEKSEPPPGDRAEPTEVSDV